MPKKKTVTPRGAGPIPVTRFAHPFYTDVPPGSRPSVRGARRMTDVVKGRLEPIPPVRGKSRLTLADVIGAEGAAAIGKEGKIVFHAVGDTGNPQNPAQEFVAEAMGADYDIGRPARSPAFLFHLGDVIYYDNTDRGYHSQFYAPYKKYPGKIIAVPGNHDGELFKWNGAPTGQKLTLEAFRKNFCLPPGHADVTSGSILRNMVAQPGVYWLLETPFADLIGLYSNVAENPGYIANPAIGDAQKRWLAATLKAIAAGRKAGAGKALLIGVHHPPISGGGSHSSSTEMLADIDGCCQGAGILPDAVFAAHSHDYQRYTRQVSLGGQPREIPFIVAGTGGRGLSPKVTPATGQQTGDHRYEKSLRGYGFLRVTAAPKTLGIEFIQVSEHDGSHHLFDTVTVDLVRGRLA